MKKLSLFVVMGMMLTIVLSAYGDINAWGNYTFHEQDWYINYGPDGKSGGHRDLRRHAMLFNFNSQVGTTEILFVGASNGGSTDTDKKTLVYGDWSAVAYGGNNDKSAEIFMRQVTAANVNIPGDVDARGAYANFGVVVYPGLLSPGQDADKKLSSEKPNLTNNGSGPWLVLATTDNGNNFGVPGTTQANEEYYTKKDDRSWIYLTDDKTFNDNSAFSVRGAICSIELIEEGVPQENPEVSLNTPSQNISLSVGDDLYVKVDASDADGVTQVRLYKDGVLVRSEGAAPYEWNAPGQDDPELKNLSEGSFVLTAEASDSLGNIGQTTQGITVIVGDLPPPPDSLVLNSSFEEGGTAPTSWTPQSGCTAVGTTAKATSGLSSLLMNQTSAPMRQNISLTLGVEYDLSVWIDTSGLTGGSVVLDTADAYDAAGQGQFSVNSDNGGWTQYSGSFTATNISLTIRIFTEGVFTGTVYMDDVVLTGPDAPQSDYEDWKITEGVDDSVNSDPDGDGRNNLLEYALGGDPNNGADVDVDPVIVQSDGLVRYEHKKRNDNTQLRYTMQVCSNLADESWVDKVTEVETNQTDGFYHDVSHLISTTNAASYLRLKVSNP